MARMKYVPIKEGEKRKLRTKNVPIKERKLRTKNVPESRKPMKEGEEQEGEERKLPESESDIDYDVSDSDDVVTRRNAKKELKTLIKARRVEIDKYKDGSARKKKLSRSLNLLEAALEREKERTDITGDGLWEICPDHFRGPPITAVKRKPKQMPEAAFRSLSALDRKGIFVRGEPPPKARGKPREPARVLPLAEAEWRLLHQFFYKAEAMAGAMNKLCGYNTVRGMAIMMLRVYNQAIKLWALLKTSEEYAWKATLIVQQMVVYLAEALRCMTAVAVIGGSDRDIFVVITENAKYIEHLLKVAEAYSECMETFNVDAKFTRRARYNCITIQGYLIEMIQFNFFALQDSTDVEEAMLDEEKRGLDKRVAAYRPRKGKLLQERFEKVIEPILEEDYVESLRRKFQNQMVVVKKEEYQLALAVEERVGDIKFPDIRKISIPECPAEDNDESGSDEPGSGGDSDSSSRPATPGRSAGDNLGLLPATPPHSPRRDDSRPATPGRSFGDNLGLLPSPMAANPARRGKGKGNMNPANQAAIDEAARAFRAEKAANIAPVAAADAAPARTAAAARASKYDNEAKLAPAAADAAAADVEEAATTAAKAADRAVKAAKKATDAAKNGDADGANKALAKATKATEAATKAASEADFAFNIALNAMHAIGRSPFLDNAHEADAVNAVVRAAAKSVNDANKSAEQAKAATAKATAFVEKAAEQAKAAEQDEAEFDIPAPPQQPPPPPSDAAAYAADKMAFAAADDANKATKAAYAAADAAADAADDAAGNADAEDKANAAADAANFAYAAAHAAKAAAAKANEFEADSHAAKVATTAAAAADNAAAVAEKAYYDAVAAAENAAAVADKAYYDAARRPARDRRRSRAQSPDRSRAQSPDRSHLPWHKMGIGRQKPKNVPPHPATNVEPQQPAKNVIPQPQPLNTPTKVHAVKPRPRGSDSMPRRPALLQQRLDKKAAEKAAEEAAEAAMQEEEARTRRVEHATKNARLEEPQTVVHNVQQLAAMARRLDHLKTNVANLVHEKNVMETAKTNAAEEFTRLQQEQHRADEKAQAAVDKVEKAEGAEAVDRAQRKAAKLQSAAFNMVVPLQQAGKTMRDTAAAAEPAIAKYDAAVKELQDMKKQWRAASTAADVVSTDAKKYFKQAQNEATVAQLKAGKVYTKQSKLRNAEQKAKDAKYDADNEANLETERARLITELRLIAPFKYAEDSVLETILQWVQESETVKYIQTLRYGLHLGLLFDPDGFYRRISHAALSMPYSDYTHRLIAGALFEVPAGGFFSDCQSKLHLFLRTPGDQRATIENFIKENASQVQKENTELDEKVTK